ncbi:hypothetical protein HDU92_002628 [Lobulomyces angularis]|nr:hypothetical protein HDU92_002628 [Lobulomyces angularis]
MENLINGKYTYGDKTLFPTNDPDFISFEYGTPENKLLPSDIITVATKHKFESPFAFTTLQYGPSLGDLEFREVLSTFLTEEYNDGVPVLPQHLSISNGASQSLFNIISLFTDRETKFLIEDPTYFLAIKIFEDLGVNIEKDLHSVLTDEGGIVIENLDSKLKELTKLNPNLLNLKKFSKTDSKKKKFKFFLYLVPTFSNPTGSTLNLQRRLQLLKLAKQFDLLIFCDDVYNFLSFDENFKNPKRLIALELENFNAEVEFGNVISNCSFSKIFAPGFRLGWVEASSNFQKIFLNSGILYSGGCPNHFATGLMTSIIQLGFLKTYIENLKSVYAKKCDVCCDALLKYLPAGCSFVKPKGGFFIWLSLPNFVDTTQLFLDLKNASLNNIEIFNFKLKCEIEGNIDKLVKFEKVSFAPANTFSVSKKFGNCLRLSFAFYSEDQLLLGIVRLCNLLKCIIEN